MSLIRSCHDRQYRLKVTCSLVCQPCRKVDNQIIFFFSRSFSKNLSCLNYRKTLCFSWRHFTKRTEKQFLFSCSTLHINTFIYNRSWWVFFCSKSLTENRKQYTFTFREHFLNKYVDSWEFPRLKTQWKKQSCDSL